MGGGSWSSAFYENHERARRESGRETFSYSAKVETKPRAERKVHANLDPKNVRYRESRDSAEHPSATAVAVFFDVTGSMRNIPRILQQKLPNLMDTLNNSGYVTDPQVFFGAVGDSTCDQGSLQVGQFESDNRVNDMFEYMWLEGGGGSGTQESYQNALYFAARHMELDSLKREKKGYLFLIGDELAYPTIQKTEIDQLMGPGTLQADIPTADIVAEVSEKFHVFMIIPATASNGRDLRVRQYWEKLLGEEKVIIAPDMDSICEVIAMKIGLNEDAVALDQAENDLITHGSPADLVRQAALALQPEGALRGGTVRL